ncbi:MAG: metal-dependent transcriptional regulator, partial [Chloroflexi bacterium]|nr:metal-dependent transcriptional regulator [Chloroflexota bacterium]
NDGCQHASEIIRSHRLWERFLVDHLGISWARVHDVACRLEHATDREVTEALAKFLGDPAACPHGNPIPQTGDVLKTAVTTTLDQLNTDQSCEIIRIHPESALLLEYLASHNVMPGRKAHIDEIAPFNGPIMVTIEDEKHALGQEVAAHIFVRIDGETE